MSRKPVHHPRNVLSEPMRPRTDPALTRWLNLQDSETFATTAVTVMEISYGIARMLDGRRRLDLERRFASFTDENEGLPVLEFDRRAASFAAAFQAQREALGHPSTQADMMIAGICHLNSASLATRNIRDFEHLGLDVLNPFSS